MEQYPAPDRWKNTEPILIPVEKLLAEKRFREAVAEARLALEQIPSTQGKQKVTIGIVEELGRAASESREVDERKWREMQQAFVKITARLEHIIRVYGENK